MPDLLLVPIVIILCATMTNYRSNSVDELKTLLESTRATVRTEYLKHTARLPFDISTATAHMLAVANIISALIDKQHNMSCEELENNQGLARMLCEMRGLHSFTPQSNSTSLGHQTGPASFSSPQVEREDSSFQWAVPGVCSLQADL